MYNVSLSYILLWAVSLLLPLWYISFRVNRKRLYYLASKLNGPPALPIIGNALKCILPHEKAVQSILDAVKYYKSPTRFWFGPHLAVHVWEPKQLETVLNSTHHLQKEPYVYGFAEAIFGKSLLNLPVEEWKRHRRMIAPAFNQQSLEGFFDVFRKHAKNLTAELKAKEGKGVFDIEKFLNKSTLEVVLETILSFRGDKSNPNIMHLVEWLEVLQKIAIKRSTKLWLYPDFIFNRTGVGKEFNNVTAQFNNYIDSVMEEWKEAALKERTIIGEPSNITDAAKPKKLVEHLLSVPEENGKFTAEELRNEVKTMIVAGMETTALALGNALLALGIYPDIQQKLYEEIIQIIGPTRDIQYEDLKQLEYLDMVIKESLRIFPPCAGIARISDQEIQLEEHTIPARCPILINLLGVHRDPNIWPNPTRFDPNRFLPEEVAKRHPYSWIPLSAGPRSCVAPRYALMELKTFVVDLVRNYEMSTIYKDINDVSLTWMILLKPTKGFKLSLKSRALNS